MLPAKPVNSAAKPPTSTQEPSSRPIHTRVVSSLVHSARVSRAMTAPIGSSLSGRGGPGRPAAYCSEPAVSWK